LTGLEARRLLLHPTQLQHKSPEKALTMSSLRERLDQFKVEFESGAPPYNAPHAAIETMHRATSELEASGLAKKALKVGDRAPDFSLFSQDHIAVESSKLLQQGPSVVSFFRGHW
jgi:hypothetical protein